MAAIYMWFEEEVQVFTTTLYPVEVIDSLQLSADLYGGSLSLIPAEAHQNSGNLVSMSLPIILISTNGPDEQHQNSGDLVSVTLPIILLSTDGPDEAHDNSGDLVSVSMPLKLVIVDTPDEKLQFTCDINPSSCSMTPV